MFESGAPKGAQLRKLDDYMRDGAECLWWRKVKASPLQKKRIELSIQYFSTSSYSWSFLRDVPREIFRLAQYRNNYNDLSMSYSCADLIAKVYEKAKIFKKTNKNLLPMHFMETGLPFINGASLLEPINIIYMNKNVVF
jgi:hypothetical protein